MDDTQASKASKGAKLLAEGNKWLERIRAAEKREDDWIKDAEAAEKAYSCDTKANEGKLYDFNILHSNVETIVPAIYNSTPVPDVRSRNVIQVPEVPPPPQPQPGQMPDMRAMQQHQMLQQQAAMAQAKVKAAKDFGTMVERAITVQIDDNKLDTEVEACAQDAFLAGRGIVRLRFHADENGGNERVSYEAVSWRDYRHGPAKRWEDRPWEAFRHSMPYEEVERFADSDLIEAQLPAGGETAVKDDNEDDDDIIVWEIWCKEPDRYVKFVRESDGRIIKQIDDPLGLSDFFPVAKPVQPISLTGKLRPVCPFTVYKKLADELDLITKRINRIMDGLKVRGLIAGDASDISDLAQADDNTLIVAKGLEGLAQTKGLEGAIMWWPIESAVNVLRELYMQREQVKASIYEITGISDIVRGASDAKETATAQQIKTEWGSLRIQKMQRLVQRLVRDLFIMTAEIITTKFSPQTLVAMSGIELTPDIQELMQQRVLAHYRVDVETDSTVKADTARLKAEMSEFMGGTGQFFGTMLPLVQQQPQMGKPVAALYQAFANAWNLGKHADDALDEMAVMAEQMAKNPPPNPEAEKAKAEIEQANAEHQMKREEHEADMAMKKQEALLDRQDRIEELQLKREVASLTLQVKREELAIKKEEMAMRRADMVLTANVKAAESSMQLDAQRESTALKLDAQKQSNEMKAQQAKEAAKAKPKPAK